MPVALPDGRTVAVAASVGVAACAPADLTSALKAADEAMYRAEQSGGGWQYAYTAPGSGPSPTRRRPKPTAPA